MSGCVKVWLPISCPSRTYRCSNPMLFCASSPITMNAAFTWYCFSTSRIFGVHTGSGPSSKAQRQLVRVVPVLLNRVRARQSNHVLVGDGEVIRVHLDVSLTRLWPRHDAQNVAFALRIHIRARRHRLQQIRSVRRAGMIPHLPQRRILLAQPPHRERAQPHLPPRAQLVQRCHSIQKPHLVPQMRVLIVISEVRIQLVAFQMHIRARVLRPLPRILHREVVDIHHPQRRLLPFFRQTAPPSRTRSCRCRR